MKGLLPILEGVVLWCLTALSTLISVIFWRSDLLVEETGVPGEKKIYLSFTVLLQTTKKYIFILS